MTIKLNNKVPQQPYNTGITGGMKGINNKVPPPPQNTGITGGMKLLDKNAAKAISVPKKIFQPTPQQIRDSYQSIAEQALSSHTAQKLKKAPKGSVSATAIDVTPAGEKGSKWEAYAIGNKLYVKLTPVVPNPKPTWYKVGGVPLF
jgi:hypothetical protein